MGIQNIHMTGTAQKNTLCDMRIYATGRSKPLHDPFDRASGDSYCTAAPHLEITLDYLPSDDSSLCFIFYYLMPKQALKNNFSFICCFSIILFLTSIFAFFCITFIDWLHFFLFNLHIYTESNVFFICSLKLQKKRYNSPNEIGVI